MNSIEHHNSHSNENKWKLILKHKNGQQKLQHKCTIEHNLSKQDVNFACICNGIVSVKQELRYTEIYTGMVKCIKQS